MRLITQFHSDEARERAMQLEPLMREMQGKGYSMRRMANELIKRKVKTPRGGEWHPQTVKTVETARGYILCH